MSLLSRHSPRNCAVVVVIWPRRGVTDNSLVSVRRLGSADRPDPDREPGGVRLDHQVLTHHQAYVPRTGWRAVRAGEEHQVTVLYLAGRDRRQVLELILRGARYDHARRQVGLHDEPRAVVRGRPGAAEQVRLAELSLRVLQDLGNCHVLRDDLEEL